MSELGALGSLSALAFRLCSGQSPPPVVHLLCPRDLRLLGTLACQPWPCLPSQHPYGCVRIPGTGHRLGLVSLLKVCGARMDGLSQGTHHGPLHVKGPVLLVGRLGGISTKDQS